MSVPRITDNRYLILRFLYETIQKYTEGISSGGNPTILDVGCGKEPYKTFFKNPEKNYVGIDFRSKTADVVGVGEILPFRGAYFDIVLCTQVLEHVTDPKKVLDEIRRVLKTSGVLILSTHGFWVEGHEASDYWRWTLEGLQRLMDSAGLDIVESSSMDPAISTLQTIVVWLPQKLVPLVYLLNCLSLPLQKISRKNGPKLNILHVVKAVPTILEKYPPKIGT